MVQTEGVDSPVNSPDQQSKKDQTLPAFALDGSPISTLFPVDPKAQAILDRARDRLEANIVEIIVGGYGIDNPEVVWVSGTDQLDWSATDENVIRKLVQAQLSDDEIRTIFQCFLIGDTGIYIDGGDGYLDPLIEKARGHKATTLFNNTNILPAAVSGEQALVPPTELPSPAILFEDEFSEHRVAEEVVRRFSSQFRYVPELKTWFVWKGQVWSKDPRGLTVDRKVIQTLRDARADIDQDQTGLTNSAKRSLIGRLLKYEDNARVRAVIQRVATIQKVIVSPDHFDAAPLLLNVQNGTIDLQTGLLREHRPTDYLTQIAPYAYDSDAVAPRWQAFLDTVCGRDSELLAYLQRLAGYWIMGDTPRQLFPIFSGPGGNGKSTYFETLGMVLGGYVGTIDSRVFHLHPDALPPTYLASTKSKRLVYAPEAIAGMALDDSMVKILTGGDTVQVRRLYENPWTMKITSRFALITNLPPRPTTNSLAMHNRIKIIPFHVVIAKDDQADPSHLEAEFHREAPGILNWIVEGCLAYQRDGLGISKAVEEATQQYWRKHDVVARFVEECCASKPGDSDLRVFGQHLYDAYHAWCNKNGSQAMDAAALKSQLEERGFVHKRTRIGPDNRYGWIGLAQRDAPVTVEKQDEAEPVV